MSRTALILLLSLPLLAQAELGDRKVDFSSYDKALYTQVVDRIKAHILARLGKGGSPRDRYFIIPFAYQNEKNQPEFSHSFITVIRVFGNNTKSKETPGLPTR